MLVSYMCHTFTQAKQQPAIAILVEVKALKTLVFMHELEMDMALGNCMIVLSAICKLQLLQKGGNRGTRQHKGLLWGKVTQLEILIKGRNNPLPRPKGYISGRAVAGNSTYCIISHAAGLCLGWLLHCRHPWQRLFCQQQQGAAVRSLGGNTRTCTTGTRPCVSWSDTSSTV